MCVPECHKAISAHLSRRGFFRAAGAVTAGAALANGLPTIARAQTMSFSKAIDLTHTLTPDFPTYFGPPQLEIETIKTFEADHFQVYRWHLVEHTGTHMDAPFHFDPEGTSADRLDPSVLVVPLAVIDVKEKAAADPDYQLSPDDITAFESANGPLPENCCVAMNSGWAQHVGTDMFRNADASGGMHFPGFHPRGNEPADGTQRGRHCGRHALARFRGLGGFRRAFQLAAGRPLGPGGRRQPGRGARHRLYAGRRRA
jgi:hypothetical protein